MTPYYGQANNYARLIVLTVISAVTFLIIPDCSSPLYPESIGDYNVFVVMGEGWMKGAIPYRDLFDHKGPLLYLIQIGGLLISKGKLGIWILETSFAVIFLELMYQCGRALSVRPQTNYIALAVTLLILLFNMQGGNRNEEWCLPFQILPLMVALRFLKDRRPGIKTVATVCGLCFGLVAMIRLNNNVIIAGICVGQTIVFLYTRQYAALLKCALFFILGAVLATLPFVLYFHGIGCLHDMLYATFTYNLKYKMSHFAEGHSIRALKFLWPCILRPLLLTSFPKKRDWKVTTMLIAICAITFATFINGRCYGHYYILIAPIAGLCILSIPKSWPIAATITVAAIVIAPRLPGGIRAINKRVHLLCDNETIAHAYSIKPIVASIRENIPPDEWNSVYLCVSPSEAAVLSDVDALPTGKYFFMQDRLAAIDSVVCRDISAHFVSSNPQWVISCQPIETIVSLQGVTSDYLLVNTITANQDRYFLYHRDNPNPIRISPITVSLGNTEAF